MKKTFPVLVALMMGAFTLSASAEHCVIQLKDAAPSANSSFEFQIPEDFYFITSDTEESPVFDDSESIRDIANNMDDYGISAIIMSEDYKELITVYIEESDFDDFISLNDAEITNLASGYEVVDTGKAKFIKIPAEADPSQNFEYITVHNGYRLSLEWGCTAKIEPVAEDTIIGSFDFASIQNVVSPESKYTEPDSGVSFTVPKGWQKTSDEKKGYITKATFSPDNRNSVVIEYSCRDAYGSLGDDEKKNITREQYTKEEDAIELFKSVYGFEDKTFNFRTLDGDFYGNIKTNDTLEISGSLLSPSTEETYMVSFSDGRLHVFKFSGLVGNDYSGDFNNLVAGVDYPFDTVNISSSGVVPQEPQPGQPPYDGGYQPPPPPPQPPVQTNNGSSDIIILIFVAIGIIVALAAVIIAYMFKKNKEQQVIVVQTVPGSGMPPYPNSHMPYPNSQMPYPNSQIPPYPNSQIPLVRSTEQAQSNANIFNIPSNMQNNPNLVFCTKCGAPVNLAKSKKCPKCGKKNKPVAKKKEED